MNGNLYDNFTFEFFKYDKNKFNDGQLNLKIDRDKLTSLLSLQEKIEYKSINYDIKKRLLLLYIFGYLKIDEANIFLYEKGYIGKDDIWQEKTYDDDDIRYVEDKLKLAIDYFIRFLNLYDKKNNFLQDLYNSVIDKIRLLYQNLSYMYLYAKEDELFIKYSIEAVNYNSIGVASNLVKYYCDENNYDLAYKYFRKCISINIDYSEKKHNFLLKEFAKIMAYSHIYHYLFNRGLYKQAKNIAIEEKEFIKTLVLKGTEEESFDDIVNKWILDCDKYINLLLDEPTPEQLEILKQYFSNDIIEKMNMDIKIYIITSLEIYSHLNSINSIMDYSAALMPIMKAVEAILYDIIVKEYLNYLKKQNNIDYNLISKSFVEDEKLKEMIDRIEYGDALHCIAKYFNQTNKYIPNKYFINFCNLNNVKDSEKIIETFATTLYNLKEKRNKIAHKERIFKDDADWCNEVLLEKIKFIAFLYKHFDFCFKK